MQKRLLLLVTFALCQIGFAQEQMEKKEWLDDYINIKDDTRSLGVNMSFQPPTGWREEESVRPHIVKKYISSNSAIIIFTITECPTFVSRNEFLASYSDFSSEFISNIRDYIPMSRNIQLLHKNKITIDKYPFFVYRFLVEQIHIINDIQVYYKLIMKYYTTIYEDRSIIIQGWIPLDEHMKYNEMWIDAVVSSLVFPDQYE